MENEYVPYANYDYKPCLDTRPCFARRRIDQVKPLSCMCLTEPYKRDGECPFCKPNANVTKGKDYSLPPKRKKLKFVWKVVK